MSNKYGAGRPIGGPRVTIQRQGCLLNGGFGRADRPRREPGSAGHDDEVGAFAGFVAEEEYYTRYDRYGRPVRHKRPNENQPAAQQPAPQTPQEVLARIDLPQDAVDFISQRMVPGSSLIVSDHGLGDETGEGTDFIVVTR